MAGGEESGLTVHEAEEVFWITVVVDFVASLVFEVVRPEMPCFRFRPADFRPFMTFSNVVDIA